jgi:hypothetical protein
MIELMTILRHNNHNSVFMQHETPAEAAADMIELMTILRHNNHNSVFMQHETPAEAALPI